MKYLERNKLSIIKLENSAKGLLFTILHEVILSNPSDIVYCELNEKLYGIVSTGDIARAVACENEIVDININFVYVLAGEYMKAREIFCDKQNINAIPVVNTDGVLVGSYIRWDDERILENLFSAELQEIIKWNASGFEHIALVIPLSEDLRKIYEKVKKSLQMQNVMVECINYSTIEKWFDRIDCFLFLTENEKRGMSIFFNYIYPMDMNNNRFVTCRRLIKPLDVQMMEEYINCLQKNGVFVLNLNYDFPRWKKWNEVLYKKYEAYGEEISHVLPYEMYKGFFADLYSADYAAQIVNIPFHVESWSGTGKLKDCSSQLYNVRNGERYTCGQPLNSENNIYFYGPCFIYGHYVEDQYTIESFMQMKINNMRQHIKVINAGSPAYNGHLDVMLARIMNTSLQKGDVVVIFADNHVFNDVPCLDMIDILEEHNIDSMWLVEDAIHCNHKVNKLYADAIYEEISFFLAEKETASQKGSKCKSINREFVRDIYINKYFGKKDFFSYGKVGAIVMNCNPFTYGHHFLIKYASEMVDCVIIFVVEEERSMFSFAERYDMVRAGVRDMENVMVVPSGSFVLSEVSFPEYFIKETGENLTENVENDIAFFAKKIAPYLNIKYRFVGEELEDTVTAEYNAAMKRILPQYGIELIEIPRKKQNNVSISASAVRKYLIEGKRDWLDELLPKSTKRILGI